MNETIYDQYGRSFVLPGLYEDFPKFFRLTHIPADGSAPESIDIREPIGWANLKLSLSRDEEEHGINYEYSTSSAACEFNAASGRDFVGGIFRAEGEDATIMLIQGLRISGQQEVIEYEGRLTLSTYKKVRRNISCGLERSTLSARLLSKWETAVDFTSATSLDGDSIAPPAFVSVPLTSQSLEERFTCNVDAGKRVEQTFQGDTNGHIWVQFDTSQPQISEIEEFASGRPMGVSDSEGPLTNDEWLFKFRSSGTRQVSIDLSYGIWLTPKKKTISIGAVKVTGFRLTTIMTVVKANGSRQDYTLTTPLSDGLLNKPPRSYGVSDIYLVAESVKFNQQIDTAPGDKLFLYGLVEFTHNKNELQSTQFAVQLRTQKISITGRSQNQSSSAKGLLVYDAINTAIAVTTGLQDRFRSDFYGKQGTRYAADGCGARRVILNGFAIRNFKQTERPLNLSAQDIISSLKVIDGTGMAFTTELDNNQNPVDVLRIEPMSHFYQPVELLRLDEVGDYREESIETEIFSTVEVGYQEWVTEGASALEEVFVTQQVTTPIKHENGKKTLTSRLIASALAIERTRREQFADTPTDGTAYDDKGFIIQCKPIQGFSGLVLFVNALLIRYIQVDSAISWLSVGQSITISGANINNGTYTVTGISDVSKRPWTFSVKEHFAFGASQATISAAGGLGLQPETGADLLFTSGLTSAKDTYNLRLTPGRILWANAPIWGGCLVDKEGYSLSNKTKMPGAQRVVTMLPETDTCGMPGLVGESEPIAVDQVLQHVIFRPRRIMFKKRLSHAQIQRLRLGHSGLLPSEIQDGKMINPNYGYISCLDDSGVRVGGYLMNLTWGPANEEATFELKQLALDLNDTTSGLDCSQFMGWTLEQAELADDQTRRRIELCTWLDVDPL
ncbi:hypothetical protein WBJ53_26135 [Spirosoma sp. SC4-14]|uniref:hypothetical protein n=1 Tax=Spirosoma sp. SC4-14 TaxID=3128900 RepID=UPI0030CD1119